MRGHIPPEGTPIMNTDGAGAPLHVLAIRAAGAPGLVCDRCGESIATGRGYLILPVTPALLLCRPCLVDLGEAARLLATAERLRVQALGQPGRRVLRRMGFVLGAEDYHASRN